MKTGKENNIEKLFKPTVRAKIQTAILEAKGNEVFFLGLTDRQKRIVEVKVLARGNSFSAPALLKISSPGDIVIHNHPQNDLTPSDCDVEVASYFGNLNVGFYIVDNEVEEVYVVVEAFEKKEYQLLKPQEIEQILTKTGTVSHILAGYEYRPEQLAMAESVTRAFNENMITVIEAGTGTGKTLAYLFPAIYWSHLNQERIVISTNTINLQEQLFKKDIPFLKRCLDFDFKAVVLKGRNNYACLRKIEAIKKDNFCFVEEENKEELVKLIAWAEKSKAGTKSDLAYIPFDVNWEKIESERENCLRKKCGYYQKCFFYKARREVLNSNIIIVNHHLLFADIALSSSFSTYFKEYNRVIIDEAHNIEEVATSHFGSSVTKIGVERLLKRLYACDRKRKERGALFFLKEKLYRFYEQGKFFELDKEGIIKQIEENLIFAQQALEAGLKKFFSRITEFVIRQGILKEDRENSRYEIISLKINKDFKELADWIEIGLALKEIIKKMRVYILCLKKLKEKVQALPDNFKNNEMELVSVIEKLEASVNALEYILSEKEEEGIVRWIEINSRKQGKVVRLKASPINVAVQIRENLFYKFKTAVLTSATLSVDNKFTYIKKRIGLEGVEKQRLIERIIPTSFDFKNQVILAVPLDINEPGVGEYNLELFKGIFKILSITEGRAFVLFTSFDLLNKAYSYLREPLSMLGIDLIKQGKRNRHYLLERFKKDKSSVLLGTNSFWEGVDVAGDALGCVILARLPFYVPTDPLVETRVNYIRLQGGNPFIEYIVPQAVIKFKQGFGRLIRNKTDRGAVVIFDKRLKSKQYGKLFLNSLPECKVYKGTRKEVLKRVREFFS